MASQNQDENRVRTADDSPGSSQPRMGADAEHLRRRSPARPSASRGSYSGEVAIQLENIALNADLAIPAAAAGTVLFAHGSGSSRHSPRNRYVAEVLQKAGFATLLMDLLTSDEEKVDNRTAALRFDVDLLARRLRGAAWWLVEQPELTDLPIGYFGASTGAAAALIAAAGHADLIDAVVARGGRPDLAGTALDRVLSPALFIVGSRDLEVLELNRRALAALPGKQKKLEVVPAATHLFEEPGALEMVAKLAAEWFKRYLAKGGAQRAA